MFFLPARYSLILIFVLLVTVSGKLSNSNHSALPISISGYGNSSVETFLTKIVSDGQLFDIDIHLIPTNKGLPAHFHFDIRYLLYVDEALPVDISEESLAIQWVKLEAVQTFNNSVSMLRPVQKIQKIRQNG